MIAKRMMLAAMAATAMGLVAGVVPADAQYGGRYYNNDDDEYRPRRFERRYEDEDDRPRPRFYGRRGGSTCVTPRGSCAYPPLPRNAPCKCDIPGFGPKRGAIDFGQY